MSPISHRPKVRRSIALAFAALLASGLIFSSTLAAGAKSPSSSPTPSPSPNPGMPSAGPATRSTAAPEAAPVSAAVARARLRSASPGVTANLWEWNWVSVAQECRTVLGPAGYGGVQVAPPQDSVKRTALGNGSDTVLHPWWEVYQPVRYQLTSRMGNEQQFRDMVRACRLAGVKVYVDAVINHTTGQGNTSYGGASYTPYNYPAIAYRPNDFHFNAGECPSSDGGIQDFNNKLQVFKCNLVGLEDLRTEQNSVRIKLARYLNKLIGYGVSGFRVDAAKHIGQKDLDGIYAKLNRTVDGHKPYWALEVLGDGPGVLAPQAFERNGKLLGANGAKQIKNAFKSYTQERIGSIATLEVFGRDSGLTRSSRTSSFVQNHDSERNPNDHLNYKDGATNILATEWLLASGYGDPQVYASFTWEIPEQSPPANAEGLITNTDCASSQWACVNRDPGVVAMVGWYNYVGKAQRRNFYTDDANVIAFSRGQRGWAAFNNGTEAKQINVQTGMAGGRYCDAIHGSKVGNHCTGPVVRVNAAGRATVSVGAKDAVAFDRLDRL
jgi:alpha-amylase